MGGTANPGEPDVCSECGYETLPGAHFCTRCGTCLDSLRNQPGEGADNQLVLEEDDLFVASKEPPPPTRVQEAPETASGRFGAMQRVPKSAPSDPEADLRIEEIDDGFDFPEVDMARPQASRTPDRATHSEVPDQGVCPMADYSKEEVLRRVRLKQSLKRAGLSGIDLSGANLEGVDFTRADLDGANLSGANLKGAILRNASLKAALMDGADLSDAILDRADMSGAKLAGTVFERAQMSRVSLERAELFGSTLTGACLIGADLGQAMLREARLMDADLSDAQLEGADLGGVDAVGAKLRRANLSSANLSRANLSGADATGAIFRGSVLDGTILHGARLSRCALAMAKLMSPPAVRWIAIEPEADQGDRLEAAEALGFLTGSTPISTSTRYFGKGDVLRNALLEFDAGSKIQVDSRFENCSILLGEGAELIIGDSGVLRECQIVGRGRIVVHGCFVERQSPGISGATSLMVSARGMLKGVVEQAPEATVFAFETGCRLRMKIAATPAQAAE